MQIKAFNFNDLVKKFLSGEFDLSGGSRNSFKHLIKTGDLRDYRRKYLKKLKKH